MKRKLSATRALKVRYLRISWAPKTHTAVNIAPPDSDGAGRWRVPHQRAFFGRTAEQTKGKLDTLLVEQTVVIVALNAERLNFPTSKDSRVEQSVASGAGEHWEDNHVDCDHLSRLRMSTAENAPVGCSSCLK
jgi:hypothetical protein